MNDQQFEALLQSVRDLGRHMRGEAVEGARIHEAAEPDVKAIRERTGLSETRFAHLIGVTPRTLRGWEQRRTRPVGPARVLLRMVEANPDALAALNRR
jgi:putative transcriptional regulator